MLFLLVAREKFNLPLQNYFIIMFVRLWHDVSFRKQTLRKRLLLQTYLNKNPSTAFKSINTCTKKNLFDKPHKIINLAFVFGCSTDSVRF